ncbi:FAD-dependent monooxygenase [Streptomyces sp. NPDC087422]|uniref:FAD-dependent monooxygenase n=1 Tax=Streptomyces sp. NPDC087422 TaxID=3365786 RepID=UPI0037F782D6
MEANTVDGGASCQVLVVGAGPTGLLVAEELVRRGVRVRLIERSTEENTQSRALVVGARTLEVLDDLGIAEEAVDRGRILRRIDVHPGPDDVIPLELDGIRSPFPFALSLPQPEVADLLETAARRQGAVAERGTELTTCRQDADGVTATLRMPDGAERTVRADWLIACDGAHSTVRRTAGIAGDHRDLHRAFLLADVAADWELPQDRLHPWLGGHGILVLLPLPKPGHWRVIADVPSGSDAPEPDEDMLNRLLAERTPLCGADGGSAISRVDWLSGFEVRESLAEHYRQGRILLAGDAAHTHSPVGGQGMNVGLQDAHNLAWKLALVVQGRAGAGLLDSYEQERRPVADRVLHATTRATKVATTHAPVARTLRAQALRLISRTPPVRHRLALGVTELFVDYEHSPQVDRARRSGAGGPGPGDLSPDAFVHDGTGFTTLRHRLRGSEHALLVFLGYEDDERRIAEVTRAGREALGDFGTVVAVSRTRGKGDPDRSLLGDRHGACHQAFAATGPGLCLLRPDRFISHRSQGWDMSGVRDRLAALAR